MSVKKNVISNYFGQVYVSLIGIAVFPLYLKYLGAEAYGLVGFFIVLQAWLQLLDIGLSPTLARQIAYTRGSKVDFRLFIKQLRSIEIIIVSLAGVSAYFIYSLRNWIATDWLEVVTLNLDELAYAITLIGITIGLRWLTLLYKSGLIGLERQVWLNVINIIFTSFRFIGALALMHYYSTSYVLFFEFQLFVSFFELLVFSRKLYSCLPKVEKIKVRIYSSELKLILPFTFGLGITSGVWVFMTQLDKLLLTNILPLSEYGYFTIVAVISSGLMQLAAPVGNALMPRMTFLLAENRENEMLSLYKNATQVMACVVIPLSAFIALFAHDVLYVWTGDMLAAEWGAPILLWYALGSGLVSLVSFQYYLQYAHGKLKLFVRINLGTAIVFIPLVVAVAYSYGPIGTGLAWFGLNLVGLLFLSFIVHRTFAPGLHIGWLARDVVPIVFTTLLGLSLAQYLNRSFDLLASFDRLSDAISLIGLGLLVFLFAISGSSFLRAKLSKIV